MLRKIYLSPLGFFISLFLNFIAFFKKPFMVYGFYNSVEGKFYAKTRVSSSASLVDKKKIDLKDNIWVGHYCLLDGIGGISIGTGVHLASHTCIYTHSSQNSIRLLGEKFIEIPADERPGYIIEKVHIGDYTFVGAASVILAGTTLGKGCIVGAGSVVKGNFPDFSIVVGNPAKIVGDTRTVDKQLLADGIDFKHYYDKTFVSANSR
ncbi:MAG: acyltransferase [Bacteroidia bacterium]|jgi:acetyltransferase-like isoleucine patch superfamily enzyme